MNEIERLSQALSNQDHRPGIGSFTESWLRFIRLYTYYTPIRKGKYRLYQTALKLVKERPRELLTTVRDGRRFVVDLTTGMQETLFFIGEYERFITRVAEKLIGQGETCVDAGANFGWYTTLMSERVGPNGLVLAFEPMPRTFNELSRNRDLLRFKENVTINNLALGDHEGTVQINLFEGEPSGHASLSAKSQIGISSFDCPMTTLDQYLSENGVGNVDFLKADIEGAEMMLLKGADRLFEQKVPPIILMEMALEQSRHFGYTPDELVKYISSRGAYDFYKVDEPNECLIKIEGFDRSDIGANVFCIPVNSAPEKKGALKEFISDR